MEHALRLIFHTTEYNLCRLKCQAYINLPIVSLNQIMNVYFMHIDIVCSIKIDHIVVNGAK